MSKSNDGVPQGKHTSVMKYSSFLPVAPPLNAQVKLPQDLIKYCSFT